jgi:hypothetical protein
MTMFQRRTLLAMSCAWCMACVALADDTAPTDPPAGDPPPTLDDLLGLEEQERDDSGERAAAQEAEQALQQQLTGEEITGAFQEALEKMSLSATLLDVDLDAGLGTQRLQEDVMARLQQLIDAARQQQSQSSSSSSSQREQEQQQSDPGRQQQQQQADQQPGEDQPSESGETDGPPLQEGDINSMLEETRAEWGELPQRVRDMLMQGRQERFSSLYEQLTREYYRRLAED